MPAESMYINSPELRVRITETSSSRILASSAVEIRAALRLRKCKVLLAIIIEQMVRVKNAQAATMAMMDTWDWKDKFFKFNISRIEARDPVGCPVLTPVTAKVPTRPIAITPTKSNNPRKMFAVTAKAPSLRSRGSSVEKAFQIVVFENFDFPQVSTLQP
jgi:hypothetical protein